MGYKGENMALNGKTIAAIIVVIVLIAAAVGAYVTLQPSIRHCFHLCQG
jgi:hypothetical protein